MTKLVHRGYGFEVGPIHFERKSGDPATLLFNTLVNLAALATAFDLTDPEVTVVAIVGDDSLIGYTSDIPPISMSRDIEMLFNFHAKYEYVGGYAEFCSRYLVDTADGIRLVP